MNTLAMAWRNVGRNRRRSVLTAGALAIGVATMVFMMGLLDGLFDRVVRVSTEMLSGHAQIHAEGWRATRQEHLTMPDGAGRRAAAEARPEVEAATERVWGTGLLAVGDRARGVQVLGVDPAREAAVTAWHERAIRGQAHLEEPRALVLGAELARRLDVELDSRLVLTVADVHTGEAHSEALYLRGVVHTGLPLVDESVAIVPIDTARRLFGLGAGEAHEVALRLSIDAARPEPIAAALAPLSGAGAEISPWHELNRGAAAGLELQRSIRWILVLVVFAVLGFGIANTVTMSLLERWREFGVLRALGTTPWRLGGLVLTEAGLIGLLGGVPGALLGLAINGALQRGGIQLGATSAYGVRFVDPLVPALDPTEAALLAAIFALLTVVVASLAAWRAARVDPIEAMRRALDA